MVVFFGKGGNSCTVKTQELFAPVTQNISEITLPDIHCPSVTCQIDNAVFLVCIIITYFSYGSLAMKIKAVYA